MPKGIVALSAFKKSYFKHTLQLQIYLEGLWYPSPKKLYTLHGPMRRYPVKKNLIGSVVSEILRYKHLNTQTDILLLYYKDNKPIHLIFGI